MTLDEIFMQLANAKMLRSQGRQRTAVMPTLMAKVDADGMAKGRASDGTPFRARIGGKSMAQLVMERDAQETAKQRRARERQDRANRRSRKAGQ